MGPQKPCNVFRGALNGLILNEEIQRELRPDEVYVDVTHSSLCGTDQFYTKMPQVLGHEGVGIVREIGSAVTSVKVGDRVGMHYRQKICRTCQDCNTGKAIIPQHPAPLSLSLYHYVANQYILSRLGPILPLQTRLRQARPQPRHPSQNHDLARINLDPHPPWMRVCKRSNPNVQWRHRLDRTNRQQPALRRESRRPGNRGPRTSSHQDSFCSKLPRRSSIQL